jgi:hypothetical protein
LLAAYKLDHYHPLFEYVAGRIVEENGTGW